MINDLEARIGQRVRAARLERGWTQQELADRVNAIGGKHATHRSTVAKIELRFRQGISLTEDATRPIRINEVVKLAAALGVPVAGLLIGDPTAGELDALQQHIAALEWRIADVTRTAAKLGQELLDLATMTPDPPSPEETP